jgi:hypothetical protein
MVLNIGFNRLLILKIKIPLINDAMAELTTILKVETDIIANISASPIGWAEIFVIMSVKAFRTDVIVLDMV